MACSCPEKVTKTLLVANQEASADLVNVVSSFVMLNETRLVPNSTEGPENMFKNLKKQENIKSSHSAALDKTQWLAAVQKKSQKLF